MFLQLDIKLASFYGIYSSIIAVNELIVLADESDSSVSM